MTKTRRVLGFTLVELMIVVTIIGILAALALPSYRKTVETSYAEQAVSTLQIIGATNRLYNLNQGQYTFGLLNSCTLGACNSAGSPQDPCNLINCQYMAMQNFSQAQYDFCTAIGTGLQDPCHIAPVGNYVACAVRKQCGSPNVCGVGLNYSDHCSSELPYANWGYTMDVNGVIQSWPQPGTTGAAPSPPS